MTFFLDTNVCIHALKGEFPGIEERLRSLSPASIKIASIVEAELLLGAVKSKDPARVAETVRRFLFPFEIVAFGERAARAYATIRADLERRGQIIGPNDLILAATALAFGGSVVTRNTDEFGRVPDLAVEDWTRPGGSA